LGPSGFGTKPDPTGARPFAALIDLTPNVAVSAHSHDGWSAIAVISGGLEFVGTPLPAGNCVLIPPNTRVAYKVARSGALIMQFFETERGAVARFEKSSDEMFSLID
jgi:hypothetical protein